MPIQCEASGCQKLNWFLNQNYTPNIKKIFYFLCSIRYTFNMIFFSYSGFKRSMQSCKINFYICSDNLRERIKYKFSMLVVLAFSYYPDVFCFVIYSANALFTAYFLTVSISLHSVEEKIAALKFRDSQNLSSKALIVLFQKISIPLPRKVF